MYANLQPKVAHGQQLIRVAEPDTLQPMVVSDEKTKAGFSRRLAEALAAAAHAPDDPRKWRSWVATRYEVTQESVRKWLSGLSLPELTKVIALSSDLHRSVEYLLTGREAQAGTAAPELPSDEIRILDAYRASPPYGREIIRNVAAVTAMPARKLHATNEQSGQYEVRRGTRIPSHELDVEALQYILELVEDVQEDRKDSPSVRAKTIATLYLDGLHGGKKPTRSTVLRLLRSADESS